MGGGQVLTCETIRDVGRVLPWLASEPRPEPLPTGLPTEKRAELLEVHAEALRNLHAELYPVFDRTCQKLSAELSATVDGLGPNEILDPEGQGRQALEDAEAHFIAQGEELQCLRDALIDAGAPSDHDVFKALERLAGLYGWIVATMQELRWAVLIADGLRAPGNGRTFTTGADLVSALDD